MKTMTNRRLGRRLGLAAAASVLAISMAAVPAQAGNGKGHGKNKGAGHVSSGHGGSGGKFCPPGLAKKGCIPPGQRKKYQVGYALPGDISYRTIYEYQRYNLAPPPSGHFYGSVDNDILLIRAASRLVVDAVILGALLN